MAKDYHLQITIKLLEDLHSGTGTGNGIVDAVQARNEEGIPVIDRHHFRGVLRDNALRLAKLGAITNNIVTSLFGKSGKQQRKLDCSSLIAEKKDCLIYWESTARQKNSRCPEDNSLRRIEYIHAGTRLSGTLTIRDASEAEETALNKILKFTTRLGAERTRGSGQFTLQKDTMTQRSADALDITSATQKIRFLLKNSEPLNIPTSGYAGNTIHSESHIPGRTLFAALCQRAHQQGGDNALKALFADNENKITVHNAYPLPEDCENQALDKLLSIPMPHSIHAIKQQPAEKADELRWPHWANKETDKAPELDDIKDINLLQANTDKKTQRPKGEMYLIRDEQGKWRRYVQPMSIRMRNMRGDPFGKLTRKDTELFSEQRIPANTHFLLDIECEDQKLLETIVGYLQQPIFIGRSKAPVEVVDAVAIHHDTQSHNDDNNNAFTLIATSDWILRGDNLGYLTQLDKDTLGEALGIKIDKLESSYQESEQQGSFNYASRLPYRPFYVIKRGSSFKISLASEIALEKLKHPIGERTREGYGQYVVDLPIKLAEKAREKEAEYQQQIKAQEEAEQAAKAAQKQVLMDSVKTIINDANNRFPNEQQWNELIDRFKQMPANVDSQLKLSQFAHGLLGKPCYTSLGGLNLAKALYEASQEESHLANPDTVVLFLELLKEEAQS